MRNKYFQETNFKLNLQEQGDLRESDSSLSPFSSNEGFYNHLKGLEFFHKKIIRILKKNESSESLIEILIHFFALKDETLHNQKPSKMMLEYHLVLTYEIYTLLHNKPAENTSSELLALFLRLDFNKYSVCNYYIGQIDVLKAENHQSEKMFFEMADFIHTNFKIHQSYSFAHPSLSDTIINACTIPLDCK